MKSVTLRVSQFNNIVKNVLDAEDFLFDISVYGEVTNFKISGGHAYFDLKDETAMLSCVMFGVGNLAVKNGDTVTVRGKVNFYIKTGRLNFIVSKIEAFGLGEIYQKFLELKAELEKAGYFRQEIKKPIPKFAKKIGVVTSETGAVIRDIIRVTRSKNPCTDIVLYPSKVQGVGADEEIIAGIKYFNTREDIDAIIVARGGGSAEDLQPFNSKNLVLAIFDSVIPVISAVGHETDFTLCDFVADVRVPTPSVAAEVAVFNYYETIDTIKNLSISNGIKIQKTLSLKRGQVALSATNYINLCRAKLEKSRQSANRVVQEISGKVRALIDANSAKLKTISGIILKQNPLDVLSRGFAAVSHDGKKVYSGQNISVGDVLSIRLSDAEIDAEVKKVINKEKK